MIMTPHESATPGESLENRLLTLLNQQISLAKTGKIEQTVALAEQVDQLLSHADPKQLKQIWTDGPIRGRYDELAIIIALAKSEAADSLKGINKGKTSLRAYKGL
jgi:hypothetical protein